MGSSLVAQRIKHLPAMQETRVQSLGWEDPLEKEMATHTSILAWRIPWTEEPGGLPSIGSQRVRQKTNTLYFSGLSQTAMIFMGKTNRAWQAWGRKESDRLSDFHSVIKIIIIIIIIIAAFL